MAKKNRKAYAFLTGILAELRRELEGLLDAAVAAEAAGDLELAQHLLTRAAHKESAIDHGVGFAVNNLSAAS